MIAEGASLKKGASLAETHLVPAEQIERAILLIRGQKVMLDRDLAELYGVPTKPSTSRCGAIDGVSGRLHVPADQGRTRELEVAICDLNFRAKMGLRRRSYAFTEQGVAMLSSVLNSERAIERWRE